MNQQLDSELIQQSTQIIVYAGNAREKVNDALKLAYDEQFSEAHSKLDDAQKDLNEAHRVHMKLLQTEARGEALEFSILLTHAQDTLMVSMSELHMAKHMLKMYEKMAEKS